MYTELLHININSLKIKDRREETFLCEGGQRQRKGKRAMREKSISPST